MSLDGSASSFGWRMQISCHGYALVGAACAKAARSVDVGTQWARYPRCYSRGVEIEGAPWEEITAGSAAALVFDMWEGTP
jgi:hypothetical protein